MVVGTSLWNDNQHGDTSFTKSLIKSVFPKVTGGNKGFAETLTDRYIHSPSKYLFSIYHVPGTVVAVLDTGTLKKPSTLYEPTVKFVEIFIKACKYG